jgi:hypothetical protein
MPINGYIDTIFAAGGDLVAVPDAIQSSGSVSYDQGFGILYSTAVASGGLEFPRAQHNQILNDITAALQQYQQNGTPPFITSTMNGGSAYSYNQVARVLSGGIAYMSLVNSNTDTPPSSKWVELPLGAPILSVKLQLLSTTGTYTPNAGFAYGLYFLLGGGGGGGAYVTTSTTGTSGGGGGAGGMAFGVLTAAQIGGSQTLTIGAAAAGGIGNTGGTSSLGSLASATGGTGGNTIGATPGNSSSGVAGGTASGTTGIIGFTGQPGGAGFTIYGGSGGFFGQSGQGASTLFGSGGRSASAGSPSASNGYAGSGYGSGGGGAVSTNAGSVNGGSGTSGVLVAIEFCTQ